MDVVTLTAALSGTLSVDFAIRKEAEDFLKQAAGDATYPMLLVQLLQSPEVGDLVRSTAAVTLKNFVKTYWACTEDGSDVVISDEMKAQIRENIVSLMLSATESIQKQLSDAISVIGRSDFPDRWPDLMQHLVLKMDSGDFGVIFGILQTANSLFKRYRHEFTTDDLLRELIVVFKGFATPFLQLTGRLCSALVEADVATKKQLCRCLLMCAKIFLSLSTQDLPEWFEDNLEQWMSYLMTLLQLPADTLGDGSRYEAGLVEQSQAVVCEIAALYAQKYNEEFSPYIQPFVENIWKLLQSTPREPRYDELVSECIQFLAAIADRPATAHLFKDAAVLETLCTAVIIPNMGITAEDEDNFEDNPDEYIRRDLEGSDLDTRRRGSCDLVQALIKTVDEQCAQLLTGHVMKMLTDYTTAPDQNWRSKDLAIFFVSSLAIQGYTERVGSTKVSDLVNIPEFASQHILPELERGGVNHLPILKADCLKFLILFRSQLPGLEATIPPAVSLLSATSTVVRSYAGHFLERAAVLRGADGKHVIQPAVWAALQQRIYDAAHLDVCENEYILKAVMRVLGALKGEARPYSAPVLAALSKRLQTVVRSAGKPVFNQYLFECLGILLSEASSAEIPQFEEALLVTFYTIIKEDVQELMPYTYQLLTLLASRTTAPQPYSQLLDISLQPDVWHNQGNAPGMISFLQALVSKHPHVLPEPLLKRLLGIFQHLVQSKTHDSAALQLLTCLVLSLPSPLIAPNLRGILTILFQRLTKSKTTKYVHGLLGFFAALIRHIGAVEYMSHVDGLQPQLTGMVVNNLFVAEAARAPRRRLLTLGFTTLLMDPQFYTNYQSIWPTAVEALLTLLGPPVAAGKENSGTVEGEGGDTSTEEDELGYQTNYTRLAYCPTATWSPLSGDLSNTRVTLARGFITLNTALQGKAIQALSPEAQSAMEQCCQTAGVPA